MERALAPAAIASLRAGDCLSDGRVRCLRVVVCGSGKSFVYRCDQIGNDTPPQVTIGDSIRLALAMLPGFNMLHCVCQSCDLLGFAAGRYSRQLVGTQERRQRTADIGGALAALKLIAPQKLDPRHSAKFVEHGPVFQRLTSYATPAGQAATVACR